MVCHELIHVHPHLPTTDYPSARKHVVLETTEPEIDLASYPGTSNGFVIVLIHQFVNLPW